MTLHVAGALLALAAFAPLGGGVLLLAGAWRLTAGVLRGGLIVFTGLAASAAGLPPLLYLGAAPTIPVVLLVGVCVLAAGLFVDRRRPRAERRPVRLDAIGAVAIAVPMLVLAVNGVQHGVSRYDAFANWMLKAKLLYFGGGSFLGALDPRSFADPSIAPPVSRQHPLGLPSLEAVVLHGSRGDFRAAQVLYVALLAGLALTCWAVLRPHVPVWPLAAGVSVILWMPAARTQALTDYADVPLACFFVAAALLLGLWVVEETPGALPLAAVFAAAALATKRDGIAACAVLAAIALVTVLLVRRRKGAAVRLLVAIAAVALSTLPWRIFVAVHGLHDRDVKLAPSRFADNAGDAGWVVGSLAGFLGGSAYFAAVPLAAVAALVVLVRGPARWLAAGALALGLGLLLALVFVYLNGAADVHYLVRTSGRRTVMPTVLLAAALLPLLVVHALGVAPAEADPMKDDETPPRPAWRARLRSLH